jgi:parvulin-like peptidyl-prolyl isomerase
MRATLAALLGVLTVSATPARGVEQSGSTPPVVVQLLAQAAALDLTDAQVQALQLIRDRRNQTLATLDERLQAAETQATVSAANDTLTLMQEIGRVRVISGREALEQLTPDQRRRWVALQAGRTP